MNKIILILMLFFISCNDINRSEPPTDFKTPIVVLGVTKETQDRYGKILIKDSTGRIWSGSTYNSYTAVTISENYVKGDTIK